MSTPLPTPLHSQPAPADLHSATDSQLLQLVRSGAKDAYGELFRRHHSAALRYARHYTRSRDTAFDLTAEAFTRVLQATLTGSGPSTSFLGYLLTTIRRTAGDWARQTARTFPVADITDLQHDTAPPASAHVLALFEHTTITRAFHTLPERWRTILWHTEIHGREPSDIAESLGLTPNAVSALAYRAREGLRQAYLNQHARTSNAHCRKFAAKFAAHARGHLTPEATRQQEQHIHQCAPCQSAYTEIRTLEHHFHDHAKKPSAT